MAFNENQNDELTQKLEKKREASISKFGYADSLADEFTRQRKESLSSSPSKKASSKAHPQEIPTENDWHLGGGPLWFLPNKIAAWRQYDDQRGKHGAPNLWSLKKMKPQSFGSKKRKKRKSQEETKEQDENVQMFGGRKDSLLVEFERQRQEVTDSSKVDVNLFGGRKDSLLIEFERQKAESRQKVVLPPPPEMEQPKGEVGLDLDDTEERKSDEVVLPTPQNLNSDGAGIAI